MIYVPSMIPKALLDSMGDGVSLQKAFAIVHRNSQAYGAVLFYASWCPFSRVFRPIFSILSSLFPSIRHFSIEESSVRPSMLSKYGVLGFPTLFVMNSTCRDRYRGPRTLGSLVAFYYGFTDMTTLSRKFVLSGGQDLQRICCITRHIALAATFVLLRLLYFLFPTLLVCAQWVWRHIRNMGILSLIEHFPTYPKRAIHLFKFLEDPCKKS